MRIYLAGKPEDHKRFNDYAAELRSYGFEVVSRWHESDQISVQSAELGPSVPNLKSC